MIDTLMCFLIPLVLAAAFLLFVTFGAFLFFSVGFIYYKKQGGKWKFFKYISYQMGGWF